MRAILATDAIFPPLTGIGRYAWELGSRLAVAPELQELRYLGMWGWQPALPQPAGGGPGLQGRMDGALVRLRTRMATRPWAVSVYDVVSEVWRARLLRAGQGAVYHSPNYFLAPYDGPSVATVHDLSIDRYPETHPPARRRYFALAFERSLRRASALITDSEAVRQELVADYGVPPERVTAIHLGVDPVFRPRPAAVLAPTLQRHGLRPGGYLLSVSTLEPRKRLEQLIGAYAGFDRRLRQRLPLVLTGSAGWLNEGIRPLIERGTSEGWLRYLGYVPQHELPLLYAGAHGFAMISVYEGFGLPLAEAMASGVPVLTSDRSCMPEVTAGAALLANPDDVDDVRAQFQRLVEDEDWRRRAISLGLARARELSWERCARQTLAVYRRAAAGG